MLKDRIDLLITWTLTIVVAAVIFAVIIGIHGPLLGVYPFPQ